MRLFQTQSALGTLNRRRVLAEILFHGPLPRAVIADRVDLTQASVSRITRDLLDDKLIEERGEFLGTSGRGRKFIELQIRPNGGYVAAIAINAFRQDVAIADLGNREIAKQRLQFDDLTPADEVLSVCVKTLEQLVAQSGIDRTRLWCCGVAITGAVDPISGWLRSAPALNWQALDVKKIVGDQLHRPVIVESIANAKNLAALCFGPTRGAEHVVLLNASLAIGCSLFIDGRLIRGPGSCAGLIESFLVPTGALGDLVPVDLAAGGYGVLASAARGARAHGARAARALNRVIDAAAAGDQGCQTTLLGAGRNLAYAISQINALLHPTHILVSGPLIDSVYYWKGTQRRVGELLGSRFANESLQSFPISSHGAAHSLAIYHALVGASADRSTERGAYERAGLR